MKYQRSVSISGNWVKTAELRSAKAKIVSETLPTPSQFQNKDGTPKTQDVAKVLFQGENEPVNVALNRATINGLIDAFGEDSVNWMGQVLQVVTEKMRVGGKAVTALYLVPAGYEKADDDMGYAVVQKIGASKPSQPAKSQAEFNASLQPQPATTDSFEDEISVDEIPF